MLTFIWNERWPVFYPCSKSCALHCESNGGICGCAGRIRSDSLGAGTDQFGTQLDPPVHWAPEYPSIDELPATYAVRPLVVISMVDQVEHDPGYHLQIADIERWESRNGRIPKGSVVMVRSDWSKRWPDPRLATETQFPGVSLDACPIRLHRGITKYFDGSSARERFGWNLRFYPEVPYVRGSLPTALARSMSQALRFWGRSVFQPLDARTRVPPKSAGHLRVHRHGFWCRVRPPQRRCEPLEESPRRAGPAGIHCHRSTRGARPLHLEPV